MITALVMFLFFAINFGDFDSFYDLFKKFLGFIFTISLIMAINQDIALTRLLYHFGG